MSISLMVSFWAFSPLSFAFVPLNCLVLSLFVFCGKSNKVTKLQSYTETCRSCNDLPTGRVRNLAPKRDS